MVSHGSFLGGGGSAMKSIGLTVGISALNVLIMKSSRSGGSDSERLHSQS